MVFVPDIQIILDFDSMLTKTPTIWSLTLALYCTLGYSAKINDTKILRLSYNEQSACISENVAKMTLKVITDQDTIVASGMAIEYGKKVIIMTKLDSTSYYFVILQRSFLESLPVVTDKSLEHDLRLLKKVKSPSDFVEVLFHCMVYDRRELNDIYKYYRNNNDR